MNKSGLEETWRQKQTSENSKELHGITKLRAQRASATAHPQVKREVVKQRAGRRSRAGGSRE